MGSIAAMVAARAKQMKDKKAQKSMAVEAVPGSSARDLQSPSQLAATATPGASVKPDNEDDEIASAEALVAASRALRGADDDEDFRDQIDSSEGMARQTNWQQVENVLETRLQDLKDDSEMTASEPTTDNVDVGSAARDVVEPSAEPPTEEPDEYAFTTKKSKKDKRKSKSKSVVELPASTSQETTEPSSPVDFVDDWATPSGKKSKKDKNKRGSKRQDSLPPLDIGKAEAKDETGERSVNLDDDQPLTAISNEKRSELGLLDAREREIITEEILPEAEGVEETLQSKRVDNDEQPAEVGDLSHLEHAVIGMDPSDDLRTEQTFGDPSSLSERASRVSFPWDDDMAVPRDVPKDLNREFGFEPQSGRELSDQESGSAFIPSAELLNKPSNELGAFEEAFERALRARVCLKELHATNT